MPETVDNQTETSVSEIEAALKKLLSSKPKSNYPKFIAQELSVQLNVRTDAVQRALRMLVEAGSFKLDREMQVVVSEKLDAKKTLAGG